MIEVTPASPSAGVLRWSSPLPPSSPPPPSLFKLPPPHGPITRQRGRSHDPTTPLHPPPADPPDRPDHRRLRLGARRHPLAGRLPLLPHRRHPPLRQHRRPGRPADAPVVPLGPR